MSKNEFFAHIVNGGVFFVQYGTHSFIGTVSEFRKECQDIVDYMHKPSNYFSFGIYTDDGHEHTFENGFKNFLKTIIQ